MVPSIENEYLTPPPGRDDVLMESYMMAEQAREQGGLSDNKFFAAIIYSLALSDLSDAGKGHDDAALKAMSADHESFRKRVDALVQEFIAWARRTAEASGFSEQHVAAQVADITANTVDRPDFFDAVLAEANEFIAAVDTYTQQERSLAVVFGVHPQSIRHMGLTFDISQES